MRVTEGLLLVSGPSNPLVDAPADPDHVRHMKLALDEARKSTADTTQRFRVGALIVHPSTGDVLSTGYTGELPGNTHAEECAIDKLKGGAADCDLYTTMQPCTKRLSGLRTCSSRVIEAGFKRCFIGTYEPEDFVAKESVTSLENAGIEVLQVASMSNDCLYVARGIGP